MINQFDLLNRPLLEGIQGNILKAHGRHHTANLFIRCFPDDESREHARAWLKELVVGKLVLSAYDQLRSNALFKASSGEVDTGLFACIHISAAGYQYLFPDDGRIQKFESSFINGMKAAQEDLGDPEPDKWEVGFAGEQQFMLLLANASPVALEDAIAAAQQAIAAFGFITTLERGNALLNEEGAGIEHFGYVDGVSQPLFFEDEWEIYQGQNHIKGKKDILFDPRADENLVLLTDPFVETDKHAQGSYFVFRKLEQNVKGFKQAEIDLASVVGLKGEDRERAGAMLVGRFEDGTPVQLDAEEGLIGSATLNNFNYPLEEGASKCPFHAHIRKSNPRFGAPQENQQARLNRMMARRGITYGTREDGPNDGQVYNKPAGGVGLLFMSYQSSIENQFEFIQKQWVNKDDFPNLDPAKLDGIDPVIGQGNGTRVGQFGAVWGQNPPKFTPALFDQFVHLKGGEYFFAPSMSFLSNL